MPQAQIHIFPDSTGVSKTGKKSPRRQTRAVSQADLQESDWLLNLLGIGNPGRSAVEGSRILFPAIRI